MMWVAKKQCERSGVTCHFWGGVGCQSQTLEFEWKIGFATSPFSTCLEIFFWLPHVETIILVLRLENWLRQDRAMDIFVRVFRFGAKNQNFVSGHTHTLLVLERSKSFEMGHLHFSGGESFQFQI